MSTNSTELGPLQILIGTWQGQSGKDVSPEPDGEEHNAYRERLEIAPVRPFSNAEEQQMFSVQYHQTVYRIKDNKQIHDQCGYFSWERDTDLVMHSFSIPRGMSLIAGGQYQSGEHNKHHFQFRASAEDDQWKIIQSPFLVSKAKTCAFEQVIEIAGSELNYQQTTMLDIYGKPFKHTEENTLIRMS